MNEISDAVRARVEAAGGRLHTGFPGWLRAVLRPGTLAITIGRRIYLSPALFDGERDELEAIVAHELEHVRQVAREGFIPFAWRYARDYVRNRRLGMSAFDAYLAIPFEVEARSAETRHRWGKEGSNVGGS